MKNKNTKNLIITALSACLICVCSLVTIPFSVPISLQTFSIYLVILLFGGITGLKAVSIYILLGLFGLPVFSNFNSGVAAIFGPTGGYIIGFLLICLTYYFSTLIFNENKFSSIASLIVGTIICYIIGTIRFICIYSDGNNSISLMQALTICILPFIIPDFLKIIFAYYISKKLKPLLSK